MAGNGREISQHKRHPIFTAVDAAEDNPQTPNASQVFTSNGDEKEVSIPHCTRPPLPSPGRRLPDSPPESTYSPKDSPAQETRSHPTGDSFNYQLPGGLPSYASSERPLDIFPLFTNSDGDGTYGRESQSRIHQRDILSCIRDTVERVSETSWRRHLLQQRRAELRDKRDEIAEEGTELIIQLCLLVNNLTSASEDSAHLKLRCEEYLWKRDQYQKLEDDYNHVEFDFGMLESQLQGSESALLEIVEKSHFNDLNAVFGDTAEDATSTPSASDEEPELHPLVSEYLMHCSRLDNINENLWDLRAEREALLEEQTMRQRYGLNLGAIALKELEEFPTLEAELLAELEEAEKDTQRLKKECDMRGLSTTPQPYTTQSEIDERETEALIESLTTIEPLYHWKQESPTFFERPVIVEGSVNITEYINKWLINQLFQSSFEILRFRLSPKSGPLNVGMDELRGFILDYWDKSATLGGNPRVSNDGGSTHMGHISDEMPAYSSIGSFSNEAVLQPAGDFHAVPSPASALLFREENDGHLCQTCDKERLSLPHEERDDNPESIRVPDGMRAMKTASSLSVRNYESEKAPSAQFSIDISPPASVIPDRKKRLLPTRAPSNLRVPSQVSMTPSCEKGRALSIPESNRISRRHRPANFHLGDYVVKRGEQAASPYPLRRAT